MENKTEVNKEQVQRPKDRAVVNGRRKFVTGALVTAPVIMTLTSRPVHAIQGLSNMMSVAASDCRGDSRYGGMSPGFWKHYDDQGGTDIFGDRHSAAWDLTGYQYGTRLSVSEIAALEASSKGKLKDYQKFSGGTVYSAAFGGSESRTFREMLNEEPGSDAFHLIAGLLNCRYFEAKAGGGATQYFMTEAQFWNMYDNPGAVPQAYSSLRELVEVNYHSVPGDSCP